MKKKIIFSCLALLFAIAAISGFASSNASDFIGCLALLWFLRSLRFAPPNPLSPEKN